MKRIVIFVLVVAGCLSVQETAMAQRGGLAIGLHNRFLLRRAAKGYPVPSRIRWWAKSFPGTYSRYQPRRTPVINSQVYSAPVSGQTVYYSPGRTYPSTPLNIQQAPIQYAPNQYVNPGSVATPVYSPSVIQQGIPQSVPLNYGSPSIPIQSYAAPVQIGQPIYQSSETIVQPGTVIQSYPQTYSAPIVPGPVQYGP